MDKTKLPSEIAENKRKVASDMEDKRKVEAERLHSAMINTFQTEHGKTVLKWLMAECGFGKPILGANAGQIDRDATLYNAMRMNLYLAIRKHLPIKLLNEVEHD